MCIVLTLLSSLSLECLSLVASLNKTPAPVRNRDVSVDAAVRSASQEESTYGWSLCSPWRAHGTEQKSLTLLIS